MPLLLANRSPFLESLPIKILPISQNLAQMAFFFFFFTQLSLIAPVRTHLSLICTLRGLDWSCTMVTRVWFLSPEFQVSKGQGAYPFHFLYPLEHGAQWLLITLNCAAYLISRKPSVITFTSFLISSPHKEFFEGNFLTGSPTPGLYGFCYKAPTEPIWYTHSTQKEQPILSWQSE